MDVRYPSRYPLQISSSIASPKFTFHFLRTRVRVRVSDLRYPLSFKPSEATSHSFTHCKNHPAAQAFSPIDEEESDIDEIDETFDEGDVINDDYFQEPEDNDTVSTTERISTESERLEESKWQRVEKFLRNARAFGEEIIDVDELTSIYNFGIDEFQRHAIESFLRGSSVVVSAPTSSGKTLIAEAAALATLARGKRFFYTTPLKALSNQKFRDFRETFGEKNVGLLTGDSIINRDAQILIMTTEILRNMLYESVGIVSSACGLLHVDVIVLDEVHYLSDVSRGTVWEEIVIYCPKEVQLICLSATVSNPEELAGWLNEIHSETELVTSTKRPVPLIWYFSTKTSLLPLLNNQGTAMNRNLSLQSLLNSDEAAFVQHKEGKKQIQRKYDYEVRRKSSDNLPKHIPVPQHGANAGRHSQVPHVRDTLRHLNAKNMLPAIWFIFSRKGCDAAVEYLEDSNILDECEQSEIELALNRFRAMYPDAVRTSALKGLKRGVAAHHAGCLPLWKSLIEDLFQRGLVKIVFATETLAAGMNMPARTTVISSLSKMTENGRIRLNANELLQMAGRAGRRGADKMGHVILVQSPYDGAAECCKLIFSGVQPVTSQFSASYGMVLNLLAGSKVSWLSIDNDASNFKAERTLEGARKLVERSFGNYVGSNVMNASKEELACLQKEIEVLSREVNDEAVCKKCLEVLPVPTYRVIVALHEEFMAAKRLCRDMLRKMEVVKIFSYTSLLKELEHGYLPFLCLEYKDKKGIQRSIPSVYLGKVDSLNGSKVRVMVDMGDSFKLDNARSSLDIDVIEQKDTEPSYYVSLGSDNSWYLFTERWIQAVYKTGLPNVALAEGGSKPWDILNMLLDKQEMSCTKLANSEHGGLWMMEGSVETWSWSLNIPVSTSFKGNEVLPLSQSYHDALKCYNEQRNEVSGLKEKLRSTEGFTEYKKIREMVKLSKEKMVILAAKFERLTNRLQQIEPYGWKEFRQISNVIHEMRALDINTNVMFPLGETAASIRGDNELWLAMVLRDKTLIDLKPAELAAVCGSLTSDGIKVRTSKTNSYLYEASAVVQKTVHNLGFRRDSLVRAQEKNGVEISCCLDIQFAGMVEAWASGLTWGEIIMESAIDDGDLARLLRRTIDLLAQIPKLRDIDPGLQENASTAAYIMDRPPISELTG